MKHFIYAAIACSLCFSACNSDEEEEDYTLDKATHSEATSYAPASKVRTRAIQNTSTVPTGYDTISVITQPSKISLSTNMANIAHVVPGVYIAQTVWVKKVLHCTPGAYIIPPNPTSTYQSGLGITDANVMSGSRQFGWTTTEYIEKGDGTFVGKTYLIKLLYNSAGQQTNDYYPCKPEKLVWNFNTLSL